MIQSQRCDPGGDLGPALVCVNVRPELPRSLKGAPHPCRRVSPPREERCFREKHGVTTRPCGESFASVSSRPGERLAEVAVGEISPPRP